MFYNVFMSYTASEIVGTVQTGLMGFFPQEKKHLPHLQFWIVGMTLQDVRYVEIYLCFCFCSQGLLINFALYKLLREQKIEGFVQQNHCLCKVSLFILLQFTKLTFPIAWRLTESVKHFKV